MILDYRLGNIQRMKYIFHPLIKLSAVIVIGTVVGVLWFDIRKEQLQMVVGVTWAWIFLMHLLPILIIGVRHSHLSRGSCFSVDTVNKTYHYKQADRSLSFRLSDIEKVIKVVSPAKYDKRIDILGFGYFFYWTIKLRSGKTFSISCMLLDKDDFFGKEAILEKQLFPIPPPSRDLTEEWFQSRGH